MLSCVAGSVTGIFNAVGRQKKRLGIGKITQQSSIANTHYYKLLLTQATIKAIVKNTCSRGDFG